MKNKHFTQFMTEYLTKMGKIKSLSKTALINLVPLSRAMVYRWIDGGVFPKPKNLYQFFWSTFPTAEDLKEYKKLKNPPYSINIDDYSDNQTKQIIIKRFMEQAYQAYLLDFHERKEQTYI